jgi:hypothetical protein
MAQIEGEHQARFDFGDGKIRKLKGRHRYIADAVRKSGKSMAELLGDQWAGWPFLLVALLRESWDAERGQKQVLTVDVASDLMDLYIKTHQAPGEQPMQDIGRMLIDALKPYIAVEQTKTDDEESEAPNAEIQAVPGPSAG